MSKMELIELIQALPEEAVERLACVAQGMAMASNAAGRTRKEAGHDGGNYRDCADRDRAGVCRV